MRAMRVGSDVDWPWPEISTGRRVLSPELQFTVLYYVIDDRRDSGSADGKSPSMHTRNTSGVKTALLTSKSLSVFLQLALWWEETSWENLHVTNNWWSVDKYDYDTLVS